jgi:hypothetical protein
MTPDSDTGPEGFDRQLEALFDEPSPGLENPELESRILARLAKRRRVRALVLGLGGLIGVFIALRSFLETGVPSPATRALIDMAAGNALAQALQDQDTATLHALTRSRPAPVQLAQAAAVETACLLVAALEAGAAPSPAN